MEVYVKREKLNYIREALKEKGFTGRWLAEKLHVAENTSYNWLNNHNQPSLQDLYRIADLLEVPVSQLIEPDSK